MRTRGIRATQRHCTPPQSTRERAADGRGAQVGKRARRIALLLLLLVALIPACSDEATRLRVLRFFFDGVPEPGAVKQIGYAPIASRSQRSFRAPPERQLPEVVAYTHKPYRTGDCAGCHDRTSGGVVSTAQEGLCRTCHPTVPGNMRYVHGPVAVQDCLFCHQPHGSMQPALLVSDATTLCLRCHERGDLTEGSHHDELETTSCSDCHFGHGGDDRYFLKHSTR
ncbi:MAG: hypothetical protein H6817_04100 [Phycisphaerales bacterium]|nr:hypothetical protein [Phycisphaerales bacterium]